MSIDSSPAAARGSSVIGSRVVRALLRNHVTMIGLLIVLLVVLLA